MSDKSSIEWTDATWNPIRGCTKVSPGCAHCYAETFAERWRGVAGHPYEQGFDLRLVPEKLDEPRKWKKPKRVFVNSMSDLFHENVSLEFIEQICGVMVEEDRHTFQVLTKRSDRLSQFLNKSIFRYGQCDNIWWGVSVENRKHGLPRIDHLRLADAVNKFLSIEPLLEDLGTIDLSGIAWVIVGGESGPGARPFHLDWAYSLKQQCKDAGVAFFMKQVGASPEAEINDEEFGHMERVALDYRDKKGGDWSEWPEDLRVREFPAART